MKDIQKGDFVLSIEASVYHRYNCPDSKKWGWPILSTHTGKVKDVFRIVQVRDNLQVIVVEFEDGAQRDIKTCSVLFRPFQSALA